LRRNSRLIVEDVSQRDASAEPGRDRLQAQPLRLQGRDLLPFLQRQMRPARHRAIPDCH
jgi:hypothetical protein